MADLLVKPSFDAYYSTASNPFNIVNDIGTWMSPATEILNLFGIKNPTPEIAEKYIVDTYKGIAGEVSGGQYATFVKFGGWIGTIAEGYSKADAETIYNSMSLTELNTIGRLADKNMHAWTDARLLALKAGQYQPTMWLPTAPQTPGTTTTALAGLTQTQKMLLLAGGGLLILSSF